MKFTSGLKYSLTNLLYVDSYLLNDFNKFQSYETSLNKELDDYMNTNKQVANLVKRFSVNGNSSMEAARMRKMKKIKDTNDNEKSSMIKEEEEAKIQTISP